MSPWILLRGLTREKRHWGDFPQAMRDSMEETSVFPLELPGNGELNDQVSPLHIAAMASHCRDELTRLGVAPPYNLLAMSMGAMVATAWAEAHPEEITACVLINTSFGSVSPLHQRLRPRAWSLLLKILLSRTARGREHLILDLTSGRAQAHSQVVEAWAEIRRSRPVSTRNAFRQLVAAARYRAPLAAPVSTLLLVGARDGLVDTRCSLAIARRWNCALAIHPEAGHDLPLDDGAWIVDEIRQWLLKERADLPTSASEGPSPAGRTGSPRR